MGIAWFDTVPAAWLRRWLILFALVSLTGRTTAGPLEKGFERLRIHDYFNAKEYFEKALKKKTAGAAYGLSIIFARNNNPFYDLDSARKYILLCDSAFKLLEPKELTGYAELGINDFTILAQTDSICRQAFRTIEAADGLEPISRFIKDFRFCTQTETAVNLRNTVAFRLAKAEGTSAALKDFMATFPNAGEYQEAAALYEERVYGELTRDQTVSSYENFLGRYPQSPYRMQAEKAIYEKTTLPKTVEAYRQFIIRYPDNPFVPTAWRELYTLYTQDYTEDVFEQFRRKFPDYPYMDELEKDFRLQQTLLIPFRDGEMWGYLDESGNVLIGPAYEDASLFSEGLAFVGKNGKYGYINKSGETVIPFEYDDAESFRLHTAIADKGGMTGLINRKNEVLIPFEYDELSGPAENMCVVTRDEKSAYVTVTGKFITGFLFDVAGDFSNGFAIAGSEGRFGVITTAGHYVIPPVYSHLSMLANGLIRARSADKWGIIALTGDTLLPFTYDAIGNFAGNRALVARNGKCGFIDAACRIVIPLKYNYSDYVLNHSAFEGGYVLIRRRSANILLDTAGNEITVKGATDMGFPSEGLIPARVRGKWGYFSENGHAVIKPRFTGAGPFANGLAVVTSGSLSGVIDTAGKPVLEYRYDRVLREEGFFLTLQDGLYGLAGPAGQIVLENRFDRVDFIGKTMAVATMDDRRFYVNLAKEKIVYEEK